MPTLPSGLAPISSKYTSDDPGGVMRTEVAGGAPRYALDYDRGMQRYTISFAMEQEMYQVWVLFYFHIIKKGAITFDMPLDSGFGMSPHSVNIIPGSYSTAHAGGTSMIVSFVVDAESQAYGYGVSDAQGMMDVWEAYGLASEATLARLAQFALYDTLALVFPTPVYSGPSLDLDFANQLYRTGDWLPEYAFSDLITFTRSTTGTRTGPTGLIETVAINTPRIDYDPLTGECKGLLIEEARTNLFINSDVTTGGTGTTVTPDAALAPDGTTSMDLLKEDVTGVEHFALDRNYAVTAGITYAFSAFIKDGPSANRDYYLRVAGAAVASVRFNPRTKVLAGGTGTNYISSGFQELSGGVFRVWVIYLAPTTTSVVHRSQLWNATSIYTGDGTSGIYVWRVGLEVGNLPTSSIKTDATAVTRAASDGTFAAQNRTVGTIIIEHDAPSGRVLLGDGAATVITSAGPGKIALAFDATGSLLCSNGGTVTTGAAVSLGATLRLLGNDTVRANAHIKHYAEHPRKFLAAELQAMTV